jgi:hypothetical protein
MKGSREEVDSSPSLLLVGEGAGQEKRRIAFVECREPSLHAARAFQGYDSPGNAAEQGIGAKLRRNRASRFEPNDPHGFASCV